MALVLTTNNFQIDGLSVSDVQGTGAASGGVPIPNPDAIQEFKVQTALYDASYGRYAGANISALIGMEVQSSHITNPLATRYWSTLP
jgi:hypothetical protein